MTDEVKPGYVAVAADVVTPCSVVRGRLLAPAVGQGLRLVYQNDEEACENCAAVAAAAAAVLLLLLLLFCYCYRNKKDMCEIFSTSGGDEKYLPCFSRKIRKGKTTWKI